ncbi:hypothetical protein KO525_14365 [Psychrosphaera sp. B3R10]|uniref:Uncharacterized protein n=1 Tax=Psychrosphaera algicola TaxID=3023714 RepID=A0ABT5FGF1_9GAMM|nr:MULTISPECIES: hypothetical protein [unclassified Psychrosphaera]MBU2883337.1 hypothetical protein [Psychrosphaera sp. I2R16]MBU2990569.1 hypothetical protein [Psychrosphaera sp. B3R10]MDC2889820.1 hypothetical protein [Psychrosphaera sp. G1-22]MDO6718957.1 hypothetical protein [Psychrosphaera sp. 1_MG-2023]
MDQQKWYKNPEMIVALSALLIGLVTAFTSIYSAYIDREYSRASVWPRLEIFRSHNHDSFSYTIKNNGTGPALIHDAKVLNGTTYIKYWQEIPQFKSFVQSHISNRTLSPQNTISPLVYNGEHAKEFKMADESIQIELCYCSIYDECWVVDRNNQPTPIEYCEVNEAQKFLQ